MERTLCGSQNVENCAQTLPIRPPHRMRVIAWRAYLEAHFRHFRHALAYEIVKFKTIFQAEHRGQTTAKKKHTDTSRASKMPALA